MIILRMHQEFLSYIFPLSIHNRQAFLQLIFLFFTLFGSYDLIAQEKTFVVVLDAGHGGHDSGNRGNGYYEKKIALNIALKTGKNLEKIKGIKVIYTRKTDVFIELIERAKIANKARLFPIGAITKGSKGEELAEIGELREAGCVEISDDGIPVMNSLVMRRAMEYARTFDLPVIDHCEDLNLSAGSGF